MNQIILIKIVIQLVLNVLKLEAQQVIIVIHVLLDIHLCMDKEAIVLHESLIFYRRHEGTALNAGEYSTRTMWERIYTRVYCMKEVLKRK